MESMKFNLFYDVWVENNILEASKKFATAIFSSPNSNRTYGF